MTQTSPSSISAGGHTSWSSHMAFLLACVGAAVGLGNIWKFPYMAGTQGGGAFVLIYLISIFAIAIPVAAAELLAGRAGRSNPVVTVQKLAAHTRRPGIYAPVGMVGISGSFLLLTFYAVIAGWVMAYLWRAITGQTIGLDEAQSQLMFSELLASPYEMIFWQLAFIALIGFIISRHIRAGLERANVILMPLLFIMLSLIALYGVIAGNMSEALRFLFTPDFNQINPETVLSAIGHSFFSVGVGAAMLITYGAYLDKDISIGEAAIVIGVADTVIAILAGLGIFAVTFARGLNPGEGPGLLFTTLPLAFADMPGGIILSIFFFLLVLFAALTSALALAEVPIRWVCDSFDMQRITASFIVLALIFVIGLLTVFSFNEWSHVRITTSGVFADKNLFAVKDYIASNILLPLGGLMIVTFASWVIPAEQAGIYFGSRKWLFMLWLWLARLVSPLGIIWVFLANL